LSYQPIFSIAAQKVVNLEALIRWKHPTRGLIMPGNFIALAEETGMIVQIGEWVLRNACTQLKHWHTQGYRKLNVAVNLSARQFQQSDLPELIQQVLRETRLEPEHLYLEITESRNLSQLEKVEATLWDLKIDDFGTGYSSLSTLQRLPMDVMKIGQSFIADLGKRKENDLITDSMIQMGHKLGLDVVAEGVETENQLTFLIEHGCDMFQGFLFSPPISAKEINRFLENGAKPNGQQ
jgi:EAL domain-containing protein (putative c-di-GMP-specific phosphodiesterase class I)